MRAEEEEKKTRQRMTRERESDEESEWQMYKRDATRREKKEERRESWQGDKKAFRTGEGREGGRKIYSEKRPKRLSSLSLDFLNQDNSNDGVALTHTYTHHTLIIDCTHTRTEERFLSYHAWCVCFGEGWEGGWAGGCACCLLGRFCGCCLCFSALPWVR